VSRDAARFEPAAPDSDCAIEEGDEDDPDCDKGSLVLHPVPGQGGALRVRHLVGSATLSCGITLEILPKITAAGDPDAQRRALRRMWGFAVDLITRSDPAPSNLMHEKQPLHKWLALRFLDELDRLLRQGLRAHYVEYEDNLTTLRGRLLVQQNMRANALTPYRFFCRHEQFSLDRPENRLIRAALDRLARVDDSDCRRRAAGLADLLHEIPRSRDIAGDFRAWRDDRFMLAYGEIRGTAAWILDQLGPAPVAGGTRLFGRFVRMNDVFERYVARWLQSRLPTGWRVVLQAEGLGDGHCLFATRIGEQRRLQPDIVIMNPEKQIVAVLDTKWKHRPDKLAYGDLYQLFAYAKHFLGATGPRMAALLYPYNSSSQGSADTGFWFANDRDIKGRCLLFGLTESKRASYGADAAWNEGLFPFDDGLQAFFGDSAVWFPTGAAR
jgi:5-methylcytosine-specific restriction enzyme subunit McrC